MKRTLLLFMTAAPAAAQVALPGLAYDSLHGRPLPGAFIGVAGTSITAVSDSLGRFVLAGVPKGAQRVVMQHDALDAIGLSAAGARVVVNGERDSVVVAVPSFATLWRAACGREPPASADSGFVFGTVLRGGAPVPAAVVAASWIDLSKDSTNAVRQKQKVMESDADSTGNFALCGIPTTTGLSLRASINSSSGVWTDLTPLDRERIVRRDLTIISVSPIRFDVPQTTTFSGRVRRDSTDQGVPDADVIIADLGLSASTNANGEFRISDVALGVHTVQVRKIGFAFSEQRVEFGREPVERTLRMSRITTLDSVRVTGRPYHDPNMDEFEERRKLGRGHFVTSAEIRLHEGALTSTFLQQMPQLKIQSRGVMDIPIGVSPKRCTERVPTPQELINNRWRSGALCEIFYVPTSDEYRQGVPIACFSKVYLDNGLMNPGTPTPPFNLREIPPTQVEAIEYYSRPSELPTKLMNLNSGCGVIIIHTRRPKLP